MHGRTIAIGDIHGCPKALDAILGEVRPTPDDLVVALGDYIDRGPDSRGVIDRLIDLGGRCRLVSILGNHDSMLLDARSGNLDARTFLRFGGDATLDSYGTAEDFSAIPEAHYAFLKGCVDFHETATHIFVHANYEADVPMNRQSARILRWESLRDSVPGPHQSGKTAVVGHTSQKDGEVLDLGHLKCIDTFCYGGGWLTALDVDTGEIWQADREGRLRVP